MSLWAYTIYFCCLFSCETFLEICSSSVFRKSNRSSFSCYNAKSVRTLKSQRLWGTHLVGPCNAYWRFSRPLRHRCREGPIRGANSHSLYDLCRRVFHRVAFSTSWRSLKRSIHCRRRSFGSWPIHLNPEELREITETFEAIDADRLATFHSRS